MTTNTRLDAKQSATTSRGRERALAILDAARDTVTDNGLAALSMRAVAGQVGISLGNLQHYYATKEQLIEALLGYMIDGWQADIEQVLRTHGSARAEERFARVFAMLCDQVQEPRTANVLLDVWALSSRDPFTAALVDRLRLREYKAMSRLVREISGDLSAKELALRASMVVLVIEGMVVQIARNGLKRSVRNELKKEAVRTAIRIATEPSIAKGGARAGKQQPLAEIGHAT